MNRRSAGRLFQAGGPATAKAQSPMVARRVAGTRTCWLGGSVVERRFMTGELSLVCAGPAANG